MMVKTNRPFRQRFLEGYDRNELREEVARVKPHRLSGLRKKYAPWALGGALAIGGIGIPLKVGKMLTDTQPPAAAQRPPEGEPKTSTAQQIASDMIAAQRITSEVSGGVANAAQDVAHTVAPANVAENVGETPEKLTVLTDEIRRAFFQAQVPFGSIIYNEARKNNLPPELVAAVVHTESQFVPTARSGAGAVGLMQLVPRTGRWLGARNLVDPTQNIVAGAKYLRYLMDRFDGNTQNAIAAYNAGEGNVRRFGGVPPFRETRNYVRRVQDFQRDLGDRLDNHVADSQ
jgi:soluble lytic murein transglycosylase-like protein